MNKAFTKEPEGDADDDEQPGLPAVPAGTRNYITPAGYKRLREELMTLLDVERPKMVETVSWAAKNGDRSENGDYLYGKKRLREIDRRIRFLTKRLDIAEVADPALHHGSDDDDERDAKLPPLPAGTRNYLTPQGYARLRAELLALLDDERPKVVETVSWAAKNGDRSENGDYLYGKKRLREIDRRIRFLTQRLDVAEISDPALHHGSEQVFFGASVTFVNARGQARTVTIKGIDEVDQLSGEVSWVSPVARALLRARLGDEVTLVTPNGPERIEIIAICYPAPRE
jgi:transcription elongation factor GreB